MQKWKIDRSILDYLPDSRHLCEYNDERTPIVFFRKNAAIRQQEKKQTRKIV